MPLRRTLPKESTARVTFGRSSLVGMKPVVFLDSNALFGRKPFTRTDSVLLLELVRLDRLRLVIPDVVLLELSRQWAKRLDETSSALAKARSDLNETLSEAGVPEVEQIEVPELQRSAFHQAATRMLKRSGVEIPACPVVSVTEVLERDLDARKPFDTTGKGFRDALIWETIKECCTRPTSPTQAFLVTNNHKDFCDGPDGAELHADLRGELRQSQQVTVVPRLSDLMQRPEIAPLIELLRVVRETFTPEHVAELVDRCVAELQGAVPEPDLDSWNDDDDDRISPFSTSLRDAVFETVAPDRSTLEHGVFTVGDPDKMVLRVAFEADCTLEGFIDRSALSSGGYSYYEDWTRHSLRVLERPRRAQFLLSATFTTETIAEVELTVEEIEEITLLTPLL